MRPKNKGTIIIYLAEHRFRGVALGIFEAEATIRSGLQRDAALVGCWLFGCVSPRHADVLALHPSSQRAPGVRLIQFAQFTFVGTRGPKVHIFFELAFEFLEKTRMKEDIIYYIAMNNFTNKSSNKWWPFILKL
jgi:hypothetical protein